MDLFVLRQDRYAVQLDVAGAGAGVTVVAVKSEAQGSDARFGYATADTVLM